MRMDHSYELETRYRNKGGTICIHTATTESITTPPKQDKGQTTIPELSDFLLTTFWDFILTMHLWREKFSGPESRFSGIYLQMPPSIFYLALFRRDEDSYSGGGRSQSNEARVYSDKQNNAL
ncbi:hypothetical protein CEXT_264381 [Caerostris extrusa]|uniref:Uncharacterized protein n=1 Tax=Caerostris extrusa TaxID=172846 RepID=A0AAV4RV43_CAEEX|nr:hypothetical protein CEXT_264381 [Caerostris extrusa]